MRTNRLFWGLLVLVIGLLLLLANLGLISFNFWQVIGPLLLVAVGVWFLLGPRVGRGKLETQQLSIPLEDIREAEVEVNHGAGRMTVHSLAESGSFLVGTFGGGVETKQNRTGSQLRLDLSVPPDLWMSFPWMTADRGFSWDFGFNPSVPLRLRFHTGAGEADLDLSQLNVKDLRLETGASSTRLIAPQAAGHTRIEIKSGAASVDVRVPEGVGARISVKSGLAGVDVDTRRFIRSGDVYESSDYSTAQNRLEMYVETGVASISVR
jgi:hypothetical protein